MAPLIGDRTDMLVFTPLAPVVMTHEKARVVRQGQQSFHGKPQAVGIAAREVYPGSAAVRHEQGITDKGSVSDNVGHAGGGMSRGVPGLGDEFANLETVVIFEQTVEL